MFLLPPTVKNFVVTSIITDGLIQFGVTYSQAIGVMAAIERKLVSLEDSNQDYLTRGLQNLHEPLVVEFDKFVDEQVHAIEETKVKIKRRKGVTPFIKNFPNFSAMVESMLPSDDDVGSMTESVGSIHTTPQKLAIRERIDSGYHRINKAMFESVKVIAKDSPAAGGTSAAGGSSEGASRNAAAIANLSTATGDPEDKAALNYHILIIENMNHYVEEVDDQGASVLREWKAKAAAEMAEHLQLYLGAVIRRPLGKLLVRSIAYHLPFLIVVFNFFFLVPAVPDEAYPCHACTDMFRS